MPRNGSGTYSSPVNSWNPQVNGALASAPDFNSQLVDIANALTQSVSADGQTPIAGNINMNGNKLTNLAPGANAGDSLRWQQLFSQGIELDIASSATTDIGIQNTCFLRITGTTTITSFGANYNGPRFLRMAAALTLTNSATLICPEGADLLTAAGDILIVMPKATSGTSDGWYVARYISAASIQSQRFIAFATTGTAPAFVLTPSPAITSYSIYQRFNVNFNANGTLGSNTINISGLGAKSIKQYDGAGNKQPAQITSGLIGDIIYDGTDFVLQKSFLTGLSKIQALTSTVAGNNLTINYLGGALDFRSATAATGTINATVVGPLSIVVPSGATLGTTNAVASRLVVLVAYNAGTPVLCVTNMSGAINLDETNLISPTTVSGVSNSSTVIYSASSVSANSPYRVVGYVDITEATAGTWATAATAIQGMGGQSFASNNSLGFGQTWQDVSGSRVFGSTYYNNTNKPIQVKVYPTPSTATITINCSLNGGGSFVIGVCALPSGAAVAIGDVIIPPWNSYVITQSGGTGGLQQWRELR